MVSEADKFALQYGVPFLIALFAVSMKLMFSAERLTVLGVIRGLFSGLFVGGLTALFLSGVDSLTYLEKGAIIGVLAVLSEYIIVGTLKLAQIYKDDPARFIQLFRGGRK